VARRGVATLPSVRAGLGERYRWDASGVLIDNDGDEIATRFLSDAGKDGDSGTDAAAKGRRAPSKRPRCRALS